MCTGLICANLKWKNKYVWWINNVNSVVCSRLMSSVHEMDCLREETVPVSGRSGAQSSVASTRRQQFKEGVCWMWGVTFHDTITVIFWKLCEYMVVEIMLRELNQSAYWAPKSRPRKFLTFEKVLRHQQGLSEGHIFTWCCAQFWPPARLLPP